MKYYSWIQWIRVLGFAFICFIFEVINIGFSANKIGNFVAVDTKCKNCWLDELNFPKKPKPIANLSLEELWAYYLINPCYLPLLADSTLWQPATRIGFFYIDLFNDSLPANHPYKNRYLVGDFNSLDRLGNNRMIKEKYPKLNLLKEFDSIPKELVLRMDTVRFGTVAYDSLLIDIKTKVPEYSDVLINFLEKVWNYKMLAINREYSIYGNSLFAAGQAIVMCEACEDTLIMVAKFATSAKRLTYAERTDTSGYTSEYIIQHLPIGRSRYYYAGLNVITSKNWEWRRSYDNLDYKRDTETGGGNSHIVKYRDKVELPNFLSFQPATDYPDAMTNNGIHEVALADVARGMLGTPNSLGCLRVSAFGAKFLRWWVPQNCKLFIAYSELTYFSQITSDYKIEDYLPFKTEKEGNDFRIWINTYHPISAKMLQIDEDGNYRNGYIIDGYFHFKDEYDDYKQSVK